MAQNHPPNPKKGSLLSADIQPCDGATLYCCQNGPNEGKRYWAVRRNVNGKYTSIFLGWVDPPGPSLKERVEEQEKMIKSLQEQITSFKKKAKKAKDLMSSDDE